jgi:hypothetical protein
MGVLKKESLSWVDKLEKLRAQPSDASRAELKEALNSVNSHITDLQNIGECLDPKAIEKVRQASQGNPPYILSLNSAKALTGLKGRVTNLSNAVHAALDVTLTLRLAPKKIKNLVKWIISGKPASEFDPNLKAVKPVPLPLTLSGISSPTGTQQTPVFNFDLNKIGQMVDKAKVERVQGHETVAQERLIAFILKTAESLGSESSKKSSGSHEVLSETVLLDWIADIDVVKQLKAKRKKGKSLTAGEWGLLIVHKAGELLGHGVKLILKLFKPLLRLLHWIWKMIIDALKQLGLYPYAKAIFTLVIMIAIIWFGWEAFRYGVMRPVEMVW